MNWTTLNVIKYFLNISTVCVTISWHGMTNNRCKVYKSIWPHFLYWTIISKIYRNTLPLSCPFTELLQNYWRCNYSRSHCACLNMTGQWPSIVIIHASYYSSYQKLQRQNNHYLIRLPLLEPISAQIIWFSIPCIAVRWLTLPEKILLRIGKEVSIACVVVLQWCKYRF